MRQFSMVTRINIALACIVTLAIGTMLASYWLSDKADSDALAVNVAGSLRMQSYRMAWLAMQPDEQKLQEATTQFNQSWQHPIFARFTQHAEIARQFDAAKQHWQQLEPQVTQRTLTLRQMEQALGQQMVLLEQLVSLIQQDAEDKIRSFRTLQLIALLATVLLSAIVIYWLKVMVQQPLEELTKGARQVAMGDFTQRVSVVNNDELGTLAHSFNKMSDSISYMYGNLEKRVEEQTEALQHSNTTLRFLYSTAQRISENVPEYLDFTQIIAELKMVVKVDNLELCLFTEEGVKPYMQVLPGDSESDPCAQKNCGDCLSSPQPSGCSSDIYNYLLHRDQKKYGVLVARIDEGQELALWQQKLLAAVADQLALALSLKSEEEQVRRLALMQERTVIARELHDSLAQALSYLKIQVTRLNKATQKDDKETIADVSAELKQGLDAAYRQLRELLTTFRLKVDGSGLHSALQTTAKQLSEQSGMRIELNYHLTNVPLAPHEEIHLLQIIREASQNAVHHSAGSEVLINLQQEEDQSIVLSIEDNGVGIPQSAEKMNHYGLAIMQERSKHLGGEIEIKRRNAGGTGVYFSFTPGYLVQQKSA
ncbi:MAG: nitrate/nitrite two-component system sensor histidine kinase [Rheinheimera sp.]|uniref:ATP-binding protein n=1 Tax=Arsukibacterium sp. UBA3155 TaxID=1946058 RepID=UPI000C8C7D5E|nr:ATP-binding protein [Arsukibacterium sp. UBA3155]MAD74675.1 nitrate/nitrite two-component system sensor histidine kinase [Rheinheimera sp.]